MHCARLVFMPLTLGISWYHVGFKNGVISYTIIIQRTDNIANISAFKYKWFGILKSRTKMEITSSLPYLGCASE